MFAAAVVYLAISSFVLGMNASGFSNLVLGVALVISSIANEFEAQAIRDVIGDH